MRYIYKEYQQNVENSYFIHNILTLLSRLLFKFNLKIKQEALSRKGKRVSKNKE